MSPPLATGNLYGRTWRVHRVIAEGIGAHPSAYLEWSYEGETKIRQARNWAPGEDGKVWDRAATLPEIAALIARAQTDWVAGGGPERSRRDAAQRKVDAAQARVDAERSGHPCYLRFGRPSASGASYNYREGRHEAGVSVYPAWRLPGREYVVDLRGLDVISSLFIIGTEAPVYEMTGTVLAANGGDGEPLLGSARAQRVHPARIRTTI